jgi:hypothetical protein
VHYRLRPRPHLQVRYREVETDERRAREEAAQRLQVQQAADGKTAA